MSEIVKKELITIDKRTLEFLLFSYFGKAERAIDAAINVAYRDMAAHTLRRDLNCPRQIDEKTWENIKKECKNNAIATIRDALKTLNQCTSQGEYSDWHRTLCMDLNSKYCAHGAQLTFGQAQKWVNMTMKYLYIFYLLKKDGAMDQILLDDQKKQMQYTFEHNLEDAVKNTWNFYHVPIDNYILKVFYETKEELQLEHDLLCNDGETYKIKVEDRQYSWSRIPFDKDEEGAIKETCCDTYYKLQEKLNKELTKCSEAMLLWEFDNWIQAVMQK